MRSTNKQTMRITNRLLLGAAALIWASAPGLAQDDSARAPVAKPLRMAQADIPPPTTDDVAAPTADSAPITDDVAAPTTQPAPVASVPVVPPRAAAPAAAAPAVEDLRAALCQALLDRERLAMAVEDRDSFMAQRYFTGSMQLRPYVRQVSELPQTWQAAYEVRNDNFHQAADALRDVRAANRPRNSERIAEIVAMELGSSSDE